MPRDAIDDFLDAPDDAPAPKRDAIDDFLDAPDDTAEFTTEDINPGIVRRTADYFTPKPRAGDEGVSLPGAAAKGLVRGLRPGDATTTEISAEEAEARKQRTGGAPLGLVGKVDAAALPEQQYRSAQEIVAEDEDEARRAYAQHPLAYTAGNLTALYSPGPKASGVLRPAAAGARAGGEALESAATAAQRRALGYTGSAIKKEELDGANRVARTVLDEAQPGMMTRPDALLDKIGDAKGSIGSKIGAARSAGDAAGDGIQLNELVKRLSTLNPERRGTSDWVKMDKALSVVIDDARRYADETGRIPPTVLAELKDKYKGVFEQFGPGKIDDIEGKGALNRDAYRVAMGAEDEIFERVAPGALGDKRKYGDLSKAEAQLKGRIATDAARPNVNAFDTFMGGGSMVGGLLSGNPLVALAGPLASVLHKAGRAQGDQALAVASDKAGKILQSKWAPFLQAAAESGGPNGLVVGHQILLEKDPEYRSLVEGTERR